jgi:hypothetical protein
MIEDLRVFFFLSSNMLTSHIQNVIIFTARIRTPQIVTAPGGNHGIVRQKEKGPRQGTTRRHQQPSWRLIIGPLPRQPRRVRFAGRVLRSRPRLPPLERPLQWLLRQPRQWFIKQLLIGQQFVEQLGQRRWRRWRRLVVRYKISPSGHLTFLRKFEVPQGAILIHTIIMIER